MPQKPDKKLETLEYLRYWFTHTELAVEVGRPQNFSAQVELDVKEIKEAKLLGEIEDWGAKCFKARDNSGYTLEEVARLLRVDTEAIRKQELKKGITRVDPFYLEAFSLIYRQSPYMLLWEKEQTDPKTGKRRIRKLHPKTVLDKKIAHMIDPMGPKDPPFVKYRNVIFNTLYDEKDPKKPEFLEMLTFFGKIKPKTYDAELAVFFSFLEHTETFKKVFEYDPLNDASAQSDAWDLHFPRKSLDLSQRGTKDDDIRAIFWEATNMTLDLAQHDPERLMKLAQLALCDESGIKILSSVIKEAGYTVDPKSLQFYGKEPIPEYAAFDKQERQKKIDEGEKAKDENVRVRTYDFL